MYGRERLLSKALKHSSGACRAAARREAMKILETRRALEEYDATILPDAFIP
jgi:hypothetical protein